MPPLEITRIRCGAADAELALDELRKRLSPTGDVVSEAGRKKTLEVFGEALTPVQVVERICREVREQGLPALLNYSQKLDRAELTAETLRVSTSELQEAHQAAQPEFLECVRRIRENILRFQSAILHQEVSVPLPGGGWLSQRYVPLQRVGLCVPGGAAAYPSTVLMTAVPAQAAGVKELAVVAPPTKFGAYNPDILATCYELGITEVYRLGGAQGVAALAYGVKGDENQPGIRQVDKIVGPGNLFVALAKQHVFGHVDIDSIAGPSEVVVVADETARADFTAADMLAQAEHAPGASIMVTWHEPLWLEVAEELQRQLDETPRGELARHSLRDFGTLVLARNAEEACRIANRFTPEHLHIAAQHAEQLLAQIPHAGAAFLGHWSPVAVGDYVAGPSHVLPTSGTARFASGLSSNHFLRSHSVIEFTAQDLLSHAPDVQLLADREGLSAHRASVDIRLPDASKD